MKGIGRVIGKFDSELLDFLKLTNGASIFDYCFLGFKNNRLGSDIDKYMGDLWLMNNRLAMHFLPFMVTGTGDNFGYLMDIVDDEGRHPIAYYNNEYEQDIVIIGSSFGPFIRTFVEDVEDTLNISNDDFIMNIEKDEWPVDINHWMEKDEVLRQNKERYNSIMKGYMPDVTFY